MSTGGVEQVRQFSTAAAALAADLATWRPGDGQTDSWRESCVEVLLNRGGDALDRDRCRGHITASCFVLTRDLEQVLLTLHRKVGLWLQLGGHVDVDDATVAESARREAQEESGIPGLDLLGSHPADLERQDVGHALAGCSVHWDLGYLAVVDRTALMVVSHESRQLQWWPVAHLPALVPVTLHARVRRAVREASRLARPSSSQWVGTQ